MEISATSLAPEHTPWIAEVMTHGKDAGLHQVVNSKSWVIATCMVKEEADLLAAIPELLEHLQNMVEIAHSVSANWENGELDVAVQNLERIASAAEAAIAKAIGEA
jgi:hypothetical protein